MSRWLLSIVCLLSLALPLQGLAAVTMMGGNGAPAIPATHGVMASMHASTVGASPCHGQDAMADADTAHAGCVVCAACHAAAALPPPVPTLPAEAAAEPVLRATPGLAPSFVTGGPDRPPRPLHA